MVSLFITRWLDSKMIHDLSWTFIHSLWQGLVAAGIAAIIIHYTKRSTSRLRYNLLGLIMVGFMAAVAITFFRLEAATIDSNTKAFNPIISVDYSDGSAAVNKAQPADLVTGLTDLLNKNAIWLMTAWFIFFVLKCTRLFTGLYHTHRVRYYRTHETSEEWKMTAAKLARAIGISKTVRLMESELVKVPAALGYLKPVILVPLGMMNNLSPDQVEAVLLHELAHIRRRDYLVNLLQSFMETVFFFNPAVTWISALIREEREACCDDIVMENTAFGNSYLEALVSFHEHQLHNTYAMTLRGNKMHLLNRVKRMLTRENNKLSIMEKLVLLASITIFAAFSFVPKHEATKVNDMPVAVKEPAMASRSFNVKIDPPKKIAVVAKKKYEKVTSTAVIDTVPTRKANTRNDNTNENSDSNTDKKNNTDIIIHTDKEEGKDERTTIEVKDKEGKAYKLDKINKKVQALYIDGKKIPEEQWGEHKDLIEKLEALQSPPKVPSPPNPPKPYKSFNSPEKPAKPAKPDAPLYKAQELSQNNKLALKYTEFETKKLLLKLKNDLKHDTLKPLKLQSQNNNNKKKEFLKKSRKDSLTMLSLRKSDGQLLENKLMLANKSSLRLTKKEEYKKQPLLNKESALFRQKDRNEHKKKVKLENKKRSSDSKVIKLKLEKAGEKKKLDL
jgi:beta-lactamase regulating signal transducer with metallopeptidase domain